MTAPPGSGVAWVCGSAVVELQSVTYEETDADAGRVRDRSGRLRGGTFAKVTESDIAVA